MHIKNNIRHPNIHVMLGMACVHPRENQRAKLLGKFYTYLMLALAIWILVQWHFDLIGALSITADRLINHVVWLVFVVEVISISLVVSQKKRYFTQNWLKLIIIILLPVIWNMPDNRTVLLYTLPILAILIILPWYPAFIRSLTDNSLKTTLISAGILVVFLGLLASGVDPNIENAWQGLWWAIVTMSTVGYGDIVPTSPLGRIIAAILIALGISIIAVITANISAILVKRGIKEVKKEERELEAEFKLMHKEESEIFKTLKSIDKRLKRLENQKDTE
ncbi:MAG: potassium channel family protein [Gammaproteobacteria bacterium]